MSVTVTNIGPCECCGGETCTGECTYINISDDPGSLDPRGTAWETTDAVYPCSAANDNCGCVGPGNDAFTGSLYIQQCNDGADWIIIPPDCHRRCSYVNVSDPSPGTDWEAVSTDCTRENGFEGYCECVGPGATSADAGSRWLENCDGSGSIIEPPA